MKAAITGGAGFIGSHLVDNLLAKGYEVLIIDNFSTGSVENIKAVLDKIDIVKHDICTPLPINTFKDCSIVFHLAALSDIVPSIERPTDYLNTNVQGTVNVLEAARVSGVKRFIYVASSSCYGVAKSFPTNEKDPILPTYPYALSKYLGEQIFFHWLSVYDMKGLSLRLFNVYGPRARTSGNYGAVLGVFLAQKIAKKPFTVVGNGNQVRDFTYVSDVTRALTLAGESWISGEAINIGTQNPQSINRLVELLGGEVEYIPKRPGEPDRTDADITKAKTLLLWEPKITLEEGVNLCLNQLRLWEKAPLWTKKGIEKATDSWFRYLGKNEAN
jgi:UDP-glucose 4-epimerase